MIKKFYYKHLRTILETWKETQQISYMCFSKSQSSRRNAYLVKSNQNFCQKRLLELKGRIPIKRLSSKTWSMDKRNKIKNSRPCHPEVSRWWTARKESGPRPVLRRRLQPSAHRPPDDQPTPAESWWDRARPPYPAQPTEIRYSKKKKFIKLFY